MKLLPNSSVQNHSSTKNSNNVVIEIANDNNTNQPSDQVDKDHYKLKPQFAKEVENCK